MKYLLLLYKGIKKSNHLIIIILFEYDFRQDINRAGSVLCLLMESLLLKTTGQYFFMKFMENGKQSLQ